MGLHLIIVHDCRALFTYSISAAKAMKPSTKRDSEADEPPTKGPMREPTKGRVFAAQILSGRAREWLRRIGVRLQEDVSHLRDLPGASMKLITAKALRRSMRNPDGSDRTLLKPEEDAVPVGRYVAFRVIIGKVQELRKELVDAGIFNEIAMNLYGNGDSDAYRKTSMRLILDAVLAPPPQSGGRLAAKVQHYAQRWLQHKDLRVRANSLPGAYANLSEQPRSRKTTVSRPRGASLQGTERARGDSLPAAFGFGRRAVVGPASEAFASIQSASSLGSTVSVDASGGESLEMRKQRHLARLQANEREARCQQHLDKLSLQGSSASAAPFSEAPASEWPLMRAKIVLDGAASPRVDIVCIDATPLISTGAPKAGHASSSAPQPQMIGGLAPPPPQGPQCLNEPGASSEAAAFNASSAYDFDTDGAAEDSQVALLGARSRMSRVSYHQSAQI